MTAFKPPTLTKERRSWLAALPNKFDCAVVNSNGGAMPAHGRRRKDGGFEVMDNRSARHPSLYGPSGKRPRSAYGGALDYWMIPLTDELRRDTQIKEWRMQLNHRSDIWIDASPEVIAQIAKILGLDGAYKGGEG